MSFDYISKGVPTVKSPSAPALLVDITNGVLYTNPGGQWQAGSAKASIARTGLVAAISDTTLFTPTVAGLYRLDSYAKVTTVDTTSSTLGGSTGLVIKWTDSDGVAQQATQAFQITAGTIAINSAGNVTTSKLMGSMVVNTNSSTAVTYAFGYTAADSVMTYELKIRATYLG